MSEHADKSAKNKSTSAANHILQQRKSAAVYQFVNKRPEIIAQMKLQTMINDSPYVQQLKAYQTGLDHYTVKPIQRQQALKEEPQQGQFETALVKKNIFPTQTLQKKANNTGLPDALKTGVENLSGFSMDDVKVHYNSSQPAQVQAHAYAQGSDIHIGRGQEQHLPHEAWHVVQQKQGRVQSTLQMKGGYHVNDDKGLESEADLMGKKATQVKISTQQLKEKVVRTFSSQPVQRVVLVENTMQSIEELRKKYPGIELDDNDSRFTDGQRYELMITAQPSAAAAAASRFDLEFIPFSVPLEQPSAKKAASESKEDDEHAEDENKFNEADIDKSKDALKTYTQQRYKLINPYSRLQKGQKNAEFWEGLLKSQDSRIEAASFILKTLNKDRGHDQFLTARSLVNNKGQLMLLNNAMDKLIRQIDNGFEIFQEKNKDILCITRGDKFGPNDPRIQEMEEKQQVTFKSYPSFTSGNKALDGFNFNYIFQIKNKETILKALHLNANALSSHENEKEVLYPRQTTFNIVSQRMDGNKVVVLID